jgi:hypothetical protein
MDATLEILDDLRSQLRLVPVYDADARTQLYHAIRQTIAALPTEARRWAATTLVADDLCRQFPGLPLAVAFRAIEGMEAT